MRLADYDFALPEELIAQRPAARRDDSRLLLVDRAPRFTFRDEVFAHLPGLLEPDDLLIVNNTRVFPARLIGERSPSGGRVELLLVRPLPSPAGAESPVWEALARPARRLGVGARLSFGETGQLRAEIVETLPDGKRAVRFEAAADDFEETLQRVGRMPLPPYIKRAEKNGDGESGEEDGTFDDRERYQTIYARRRGAIAAPTAGLHFTAEILNAIRARGVGIVEVTLHVGYGTFEPVRESEDLSRHRVAPERCEIEPEAAERIERARHSAAAGAGRGRVVAVGTTTTRALESIFDQHQFVKPGVHTADLTILPGHRFRVVNALVTNFHLPRSSLLLLAAAFAGREEILSAYRHAVRERYRFYSYGDCMLIR